MKLTFIDVHPQDSPRDRGLARARANAHVAHFRHQNRVPLQRVYLRTGNPTPVTTSISSSLPPGSGNITADSVSAGPDDQLDVADTSAIDLTTCSTNVRSLSSCTEQSEGKRYATQLAKITLSWRSSHPPNPWDTIKGGNSDPFACMPIMITPEVNDIIVFFHSRLLNLFSAGKPQPDSPELRYYMASQGLVYDTYIDGLRDECSSKSFLVVMSAFRAKYANSDRKSQQHTMLEFQCQNTLRSRIRASSDVDEPILYSVTALFTASVVSRDFDQATCHGEYLHTLLMARLNKDTPIPLGLLKNALWADTQLALMRIQRSILNGEVWIPGILAPIFAPLKPYLRDLPAEIISPSSFDSTVSSGPLNAYLVQTRQCLALSIDPSYQFFDFGISSILFLVCISGLAELGFLNHYLNTTDLLRTCSIYMSAKDRLRYNVEAALSMAIVYLIDWFNGQCSTQRLVTKGDKLTRTLRSAISSLLKCINTLSDQSSHTNEDNNHNEYINAYIFVLFVQAQAERWQTLKEKGRKRAAFDCECDVELARYAKIKGLKNWKDVKGVLDLFVYSEMIEPWGGGWIGEILNGPLFEVESI